MFLPSFIKVSFVHNTFHLLSQSTTVADRWSNPIHTAWMLEPIMISPWPLLPSPFLKALILTAGTLWAMCSSRVMVRTLPSFLSLSSWCSHKSNVASASSVDRSTCDTTNKQHSGQSQKKKISCTSGFRCLKFCKSLKHLRASVGNKNLTVATNTEKAQ